MNRRKRTNIRRILTKYRKREHMYDVLRALDELLSWVRHHRFQSCSAAGHRGGSVSLPPSRSCAMDRQLDGRGTTTDPVISGMNSNHRWTT